MGVLCKHSDNDQLRVVENVKSINLSKEPGSGEPIRTYINIMVLHYILCISHNNAVT